MNSPQASRKQPPEGAIPAPPAWANLRWSFADAAKQNREASASDFTPSRAAERAYERQLTNLSKQVATICRTGGSPAEIERKLREYASVVEPWARQSAANMTAGVRRKNDQAWQALANRMGLDMRALMHSPGIGAATRAAIDGNAQKITTIVTGTADKVAEAIADNMAAGSRAEDLAKRIADIGYVSESRARTIARTEVSKAQTALTLARAESVGSSGYIWRTARDGDTRPSHRAMEGKFVPWDTRPTIDGMTGHAGEFPNCRCYPEPVVPREDGGVYKPNLPTQGQELRQGAITPLSQWEREQPALSMATEFAAKLGVEADYSGGLGGEFEAGLYNKSLAEAKVRGLHLPSAVKYDKQIFMLPNNRDALAIYDPNTNTVYMNPTRTPAQIKNEAKISYKQGASSSGSPQHTARHEAGHAALAGRNKALFADVDAGRVKLTSDEQVMIALEVSVHAAIDPVEFVAEVYAGLLGGKKYGKGVMTLYTKFGGPLI